MKIGIDISQITYEGAGVARLTKNLVRRLLSIDRKNEYILFYSSLRRNFQFSIFSPVGEKNSSQVIPGNVTIKRFRFPPILLNLLWNKLHVLPIEWLIGDVDIFVTSDWTEPPAIKAKKATILYDLIVYKYPDETDKKIIKVQKRKLKWVKKESKIVFCISQSTKKDAEKILGIENERLKVMYPGV